MGKTPEGMIEREVLTVKDFVGDTTETNRSVHTQGRGRLVEKPISKSKWESLGEDA